jgi:hypothetical protein
MRRTIGSLLLAAGTALLPLVAFAADDGAVELTNPLGVNDPKLLVLRILRYSLGFLGILALVMIIYGGFLMLTSGGNADIIKKAKGTIIWASVGIAIVLSSWQILQFIFSTINTVSN